MAMMHLDFPRQKGWLRWDELGCMARALGFPSEVYYNNIPEEFQEEHPEDDGLSIKNLLVMMKVHKVFNKAVDKTCNIHTDEWNLCVIEKAVHLLDSHVVTFEELYRIRMAYQVYENADTKGLLLTEKSLLRTLKMCDRMISPLKMMHRIKHMRDHFEEDGRIQLHEFLDLILWCDVAEQVQLEPPDLSSDKNEEDMYSIAEFETLLQHYDEKLHHRLNDEYRAQELTFTKEKFGSKKLPKDVPPVDPEVRKKQVAYHKDKYTFMQNELCISARNCHQAKAGKVRGRPITAPDLLLYHELEASMRVSTLDPRPATVYETVGHLIRPLTRQSTIALSDVKNIVPRPDIHRYKRPATPSAVNRSDKMDHERQMQSLGFEMATVEHKYEQLLMEELDQVLPSYKAKMATRERIQTPVKEEPKVIAEPRPSLETLERLAYHDREGPRPAHGKACDARYRGWHKARVKRGSHYILVAPAFDNTDVGRQLNKLRKNSMREGKLDKYVHRLTTKDKIVPDKPKSRAKKLLAPLDLEAEQADANRPPMPVRESTRIWDPETGPARKSKIKAGDKGSKTSPLSTGRSSDVSWHHLKIYNDEQHNNAEMAQPMTMEAMGRETTLEAIKEESGRNTRISALNQSRLSQQGIGQQPGDGRLDKNRGSKNVTVKTPLHPVRVHQHSLEDVSDILRSGTTRSALTGGTGRSKVSKKQRVSLDRLVTRVEGMVSHELQNQLKGMDPNRPVTVC